ncbi:MAG: tetratricopeptide (TPR) repeat protein [Rhodothermales bacterium]
MSWLRLVLLSIVLSTLANPAWSHPDLLAQIEALDLKIQEQANNVDLLIKRGDLHRRHQDYSAATRDFEAARKTEPTHSVLDFYQGRLLLELGKLAGAEDYLSRYVKSHPEHAKAWILRGEASIGLNNPLKANEYFSQAIQRSKSPSPDMYRQQILSLVVIGHSKFPAALQAVNNGLQQFGIEVTLLGLGVDISLASNQLTQAQLYLDMLPKPLFKLPQWKERLNRVDCLAANDQSTAQHCITQAKGRLASQINVFINSY